jgi:hypothetical protein
LKKTAPKLVIHRETLRNLDLTALTGAQAAAGPSSPLLCISTSANDACPTWGETLCGCETEAPRCITEAGVITG